MQNMAKEGVKITSLADNTGHRIGIFEFAHASIILHGENLLGYDMREEYQLLETIFSQSLYLVIIKFVRKCRLTSVTMIGDKCLTDIFDARTSLPHSCVIPHFRAQRR